MAHRRLACLCAPQVKKWGSILVIMDIIGLMVYYQLNTSYIPTDISRSHVVSNVVSGHHPSPSKLLGEHRPPWLVGMTTLPVELYSSGFPLSWNSLPRGNASGIQIYHLHKHLTVVQRYLPQNTRNISDSPKLLKIGIGLGMTTRGIKGGHVTPTDLHRLPFFKSLLPSFCDTADSGIAFHFFVAFDYDDPLLKQGIYLDNFASRFYDVTYRKCTRGSTYIFHFVECQHRHSPAWAQNDAMIEAYVYGMEYFYRVNDDTMMYSKDWARLFIRQLDTYLPANVGVVGPTHRGGNQAILTYDFVQRSHIEVFGFYYPRAFPDWYADRWISQVYLPGRQARIKVELRHTMELGNRYKVHYLKGDQVKEHIMKSKLVLKRYITAVEKGDVYGIPNKSNIITMSLWGTDFDMLWGAIRNAQLRPIFFPDWSLRFYVTSQNNSKSVPAAVLYTLQRLGAQIVYIDRVLKLGLHPGHHPTLWKYEVLDDLGISRVLFRSPTTRLSERDAKTVREWENSNSYFHSIRDHPKHLKHKLMDNLWGITSQAKWEHKNRKSFEQFLSRFPKNETDINTVLSTMFEPFIQSQTLYHDSVSCDPTNSMKRITPPRDPEHRFIGEEVGAFGKATNQKDTQDLKDYKC